ncbi:hypothetical protein GF386_02690 [Candidatus Pacearchaeota archaeon]|nr:hypothetical protein [Candidatus Pacearchaeota archaeon]MBD3283056.1 hypothetical protein [Candidatus Pacearchaeota archaeon]
MNITLIILIIYLVLMFFIAWYFSRKEGIEAYFVNKKKTGLWMMALASVSSMIGAGATVAIASETYNSGISYGLAIPISLATGAVLLGLIAGRIKKIGEKYEAYTLVDFFEKRFDKKNKIIIFIMQIFLIVVWTAAQAVAIASLASVLLGVNYTIALLFAAGITILYTAIGGLKIDIITDFIQFWIILVVFVIMFFSGYAQVDGISNLLANVPEGHLNPFAFAGVAWFFAVIFLSGFIYLGDSSNWQRIVSAKTPKTARNSFFLSIPIFLILGLIILFFGLSASILLGDINQDLALFLLMEKILPGSLVGVGFAAILAVIMSSVDSLLVSGSTIIYRGLFRKNEFNKKKEIFYARIITMMFGVCSFAVAFLVPKIVTLSLFAAYLAVMFAIPVIFGMYTKVSSNASFFAVLFAFLTLVVFFPIIRANSFIIPLVLSLGILLFYDRFFKK